LRRLLADVANAQSLYRVKHYSGEILCYCWLTQAIYQSLPNDHRERMWNGDDARHRIVRERQILARRKQLASPKQGDPLARRRVPRDCRNGERVGNRRCCFWDGNCEHLFFPSVRKGETVHPGIEKIERFLGKPENPL
jgi:hypothetical protein